MHVRFRGLSKTLKKIFHKFDLEITNAPGRDLSLHHAIRPPAKIHGRSGERFVHRHEEISRAQNSKLGAESFLYRFAERNPDIFDSVMLVDIEIATRVQVQIKRSVACNQLKHVIKETDSRRDV